MIRTLPALLVTAFAAISGCQKPPAPIAKTAPPQVIVAIPTTQTVTDFEDFTGHIQPIQSANLHAQVTGYLKEVHFRDGADVKKDTLLFEIDPATYLAELERADAAVAQAEAKLNRLTRDLERAIPLVNKGSVAQEELDRISGDRDEARAAVRVANAVRNLAKQNVEFTRVRAPFDGRLSKRTIDPGNLVKANETVLTNLIVLDPVYATFDVDEHTVLRLRRLIQSGKLTTVRDNPMDVKIGLADEEGYSLSGRIEFSDNRVDQNTGTLLVRTKLTNPRKRTGGPFGELFDAALTHSGRPRQYLLSAGMFVRLRVPIGPPRAALMVPEEALASDQGQRLLYVVNAQDEVERRTVTLGPQVDRLRVIESGIASSERVVVNGLQRIRPGIKVNPKTEVKPKPAS